MTEIQGIERITMPMPFPLKHTHAYLLETSDGWVMVDSGYGWQEAADVFLPALRGMISPAKPLRAVIITHFHPDHTGFAGLLERDYGAEVIIHRADWDQLNNPPNRYEEDEEGNRPELFRQAGIGTRPPWEDMRERTSNPFGNAEHPTLAIGGERRTFGDRTLELVWTPGHTDGHLCIYDEGEDILFTGDHVLGRITPHIGMYHGGESNPLHDYEQSLDLVAARAPGRALPAHEEAFDDVAGRAMEIKEHHQHRRQEILDAIGGGKRLPIDITKDVFPRRRDDRMQLFMALSETMAHLDAMVREGTVTRAPEGEQILYQQA